MPLYEYQCRPNGHRFEVRHGMTESPVHTCPECEGEVRRVINPVGIVFKGSGFYATDSRKASQATSDSKPSSGSDTEKKSESTDKKPADSGDQTKAAS